MNVTNNGHQFFYVATRVEDAPIPSLPAVKRKCSVCDKDVWITEWTYNFARISKIICSHCA